MIFMDIESLYHDYVPRVSSPEMAISLEMARVLHAYALRDEVEEILDLGSGLSSAILRSTGKHVITYDDSPQWLERTREFLQRHNLSTDSMHEWQHHDRLIGVVDLVFHDLGTMVLRRSTLQFAFRKAERWLILDDLHIQPYNWAVRTALDFTPKAKVVELPETLDSFGRYGLAIDLGDTL